ncbi:ABC transporter substrate-binding protein [Roseovarius aestuarii]|nr:ABC transporter substrate-binding protein [Roseovarius aestuarii]
MKPTVIKDKKNGLNRRELMKTAGGAAFGLAASGLILPRAAHAAVKGGHLRVGLSQGTTSDSVVPGSYDQGFLILMSYTMHGKMTVVGSDNQLHGDLAESWEGSDGAKVWTFKLRDAEFHNGKKVQAKDVIASLNFHRGEDSTSAAKPIVANIKDIKADGTDTVIFTLNTGDADFPYILNDYQLCIGMAGDDGKIDWTDDGSRAGPYKLAKFQPGIKATYERAENHWNSETGHLDSCDVFVISDTNARQNAILTGEVDVIDNPDVRTMDMLAMKPNITVEEAPGFRFYGFTMFVDTAPYDNNDLRLALKYGVDREAMLDVALLGHGVVGNDNPITPSYRYHNKELEQRTYDPDRAKHHLKKAGFDSIDLDLSTSTAAFGTAVDAAIMYKSNLEAANINLNVINEAADSYWSNVWLKKPFITTDWSGRATEDLMFSVMFKDDAPWNDTHWGHDRFQKLLLDARAELNEELRAEMYGEMQTILTNEGGLVAPVIPNNIWAFDNKVAHAPEMSTTAQLDGYHFISRWWIA